MTQTSEWMNEGKYVKERPKFRLKRLWRQVVHHCVAISKQNPAYFYKGKRFIYLCYCIGKLFISSFFSCLIFLTTNEIVQQNAVIRSFFFSFFISFHSFGMPLSYKSFLAVIVAVCFFLSCFIFVWKVLSFLDIFQLSTIWP